MCVTEMERVRHLLMDHREKKCNNGNVSSIPALWQIKFVEPAACEAVKKDDCCALVDPLHSSPVCIFDLPRKETKIKIMDLNKWNGNEQRVFFMRHFSRMG